MLIQVTKTELREVEIKLPAYFKDGAVHYCITEFETVVYFQHYDLQGTAISTNPKGSCTYDSALSRALKSEPITATSFWYAFEKTVKIIQESLSLHPAKN